jgi:hypothetical protein
VPVWKVRIIYNNTDAEEVEIDIVTFQNNDSKPYKILKSKSLLDKSSPIKFGSKTNFVDVRMEDKTEIVHIYSKTIKNNL